MKTGANVKFRGNVHKFIELIPVVGQQQYKYLAYSCLVVCTNISLAS